MRPFTIYHSITESFPVQQEKLVSLILKSVQPDIVYLLGASLYRRRTESIFCPTSPNSQHVGGYFFLVLVNNTHDRSLPQWQDQIEQHCSTVMPVTIILLETVLFNGWLTTGHPFARTVYQSATPVFETDNLSLSAVGPYNPEVEQKAIEKLLRDGLTKSQGFLAGVDLFRARKEYNIAAFMLHQAAEQALGTLIKTGTGYHCCTHNIERLLRYASMVSYQIPDIFPKKTDNEKRLFNILQKAYIESRYGDGVSIGFNDLLELTERVRIIQGILEDYGNRIFRKNGDNSNT